MESIPVRIRYSEDNVVLDKVTSLSKEGNLVFNDDGGDGRAHLNTAVKFAFLTAASPLVSLARLVRSAVFLCAGNFERAGREFIGSLATPLFAVLGLAGTLLSSLVYVVNSEKSFYISLRRTYAYFEAWVGQVNLNSHRLQTYSHRVSAPTDFTNRIWTTAPCMQPVLEHGHSHRGGLLDAERMRKIFPFLEIDGVHKEEDQVVLQSHYTDEQIEYIACNGALEHRKASLSCCCCWRIDVVYDRFLCCELSKGSCSSIANSGDSCGYGSCSMCGIGACCCYATENNKMTTINSGCFGPSGLSFINNYKRA